MKQGFPRLTLREVDAQFTSVIWTKNLCRQTQVRGAGDVEYVSKVEHDGIASGMGHLLCCETLMIPSASNRVLKVEV